MKTYFAEGVAFLMDAPHSFELEDPAWRQHLAQHGYAVVRGVASAQEVAVIHDEFWDCFEAIHPGLKRDSLPTWEDHWRGAGEPETLRVADAALSGPPRDQLGGRCVAVQGCCDACALPLLLKERLQAAWHVRGLPKVKAAFAAIW